MNYKHLSVSERETIQKMLWEKKSVRAVAAELGRSPSSVSREVAKNRPPERNVYTPRLAHERALEKRKSRGRKDRLEDPRVRAYVTERLKQGWSPEQISGCIFRDIRERVSHETVYRFVFSQKRACPEDLRPFLRRKQSRRQPHGGRRYRRVATSSGKSIEERPSVVERRKRVGDWEGDSVESRDHLPGINTLVERKTGYVLITKLKDKTSAATVRAMRRISLFPHATVTLDNGPENRNWRRMEAELGVTVYYAHPYHSWERGTNENTNGLIREYFPKGTDFRTISEEEISRVEHLLNTRPRKRLGYLSPLQAMGGAVTC